MSTPPPLPPRPPLAPMDPELAVLLDAERKRAAPENAARAAVAAQLGAILERAAPANDAPRAAKDASSAPRASTTRNAPSATAGAIRAWGARQVAQVALVSFVGGGVVGAWAHARLTPAEPLATPPAPTALFVPPSATASAPAPLPEPTETARAPEPAPTATARPDSSARAASRSPDQALQAEQVLVETGRAALARGDAPSALAALERHAREFPHGRLAEERDVLRVQALSLAGRTDEARSRADAFRANYPKSVFLPLLDDVPRSP